MSSCKECGHPTEWAQDIGSAVCTHCGTLADPSQQSTLASSPNFFNHTHSHDAPSSSTYTRPTTLKSIRRSTAWDLPGQGADSRNERNKVLRSFSLTSLPTTSSTNLLTVWDTMVCQPAPMPSSTTRCSVLP
ncbi:hypothetical protein BJV74DRAFT_847843 [Russula compacta]|nr:hypothetical protein BJV74DRAFT_847843 [Russula compacta]